MAGYSAVTPNDHATRLKLVPLRQLNVGNGIVLCKRICHDASTMKQLRDKSFSEFDIRSFKNKCYYDCNVCLTALKTVTFMEMIV